MNEYPDATADQLPDPNQAPDLINTEPRTEDGEQDVDQEPGYEISEQDTTDEVSDPAIYQVA